MTEFDDAPHADITGDPEKTPLTLSLGLRAAHRKNSYLYRESEATFKPSLMHNSVVYRGNESGSLTATVLNGTVPSSSVLNRVLVTPPYQRLTQI